MTDERCKQLMEQCGYPNSISLKEALQQVANETEQEVRAALATRPAPARMPMPKSCRFCPIVKVCQENYDFRYGNKLCKSALRKAWAWVRGVKG